MSARKKKKKDKKKRDKKGPSLAPKPGPGRQALLDSGAIIVEAAGEEKMSDVLAAFVAPYSELCGTEEELEKVLAVALIAWNAVLCSDSERDDFIQDMVQAFPSEARQATRAIIDEMMERKRSYFANNKRMMLH